MLLKWDTSHPLLADETFTIWIYSLNGTSVSPRTGTTRSRQYPLRGLSGSFQYTLRVQVLSRLGGYNAFLLYIHTDRDTVVPIYAVGGLVAGLFLVLVLAAGVLVLVVALLIKRRKNRKYAYTKQTQESLPEETGNKFKEYIPLSGIHSIISPQTGSSEDSPDYKYEPMPSVAPVH